MPSYCLDVRTFAYPRDHDQPPFIGDAFVVDAKADTPAAAIRDYLRAKRHGSPVYSVACYTDRAACQACAIPLSRWMSNHAIAIRQVLSVADVGRGVPVPARKVQSLNPTAAIVDGRWVNIPEPYEGSFNTPRRGHRTKMTPHVAD